MTQASIRADRQTFILRIYDEAKQLAEQARYGLPDHRGAARAAGLGPADQLKLTGEILRLSARIMHAMAWLMAQRAVLNGEISMAEAVGPDYRLEGQEICLAPSALAADSLPAPLPELMDRSDRLYRRVMRLEQEIVAALPDAEALALASGPAGQSVGRLMARSESRRERPHGV